MISEKLTSRFTFCATFGLPSKIPVVNFDISCNMILKALNYLLQRHFMESKMSPMSFLNENDLTMVFAMKLKNILFDLL